MAILGFDRPTFTFTGPRRTISKSPNRAALASGAMCGWAARHAGEPAASYQSCHDENGNHRRPSRSASAFDILPTAWNSSLPSQSADFPTFFHRKPFVVVSTMIVFFTASLDSGGPESLITGGTANTNPWNVPSPVSP